MFKTEHEFTLPMGYLDGEGTLHREGTMRLATAADEIYPLKPELGNKHGGVVSQKSPVISLGISSDLRLQTSVFFQSKRPRHRRGLLRNLHSIRSR